MLKPILIAAALATAGPALAQRMPPPPSASDPSPSTAKPAGKPGSVARKAAPRPRSQPAAAPRQSAAPLRPFDTRDIRDANEPSRFGPSLTPSGGLGVGGRF